MTSRTSLLSIMALGAVLVAPLAFAQDADTSARAQTATSAQTATAETPATAAMDASATAHTAAATDATAATPAAAAGAKKVTWTDLDADKDGKLTKTEAAPIQSLTEVFDQADADTDGALTPDEYKAYLAKQGKPFKAGNQG